MFICQDHTHTHIYLGCIHYLSIFYDYLPMNVCNFLLPFLLFIFTWELASQEVYSHNFHSHIPSLYHLFEIMWVVNISTALHVVFEVIEESSSMNKTMKTLKRVFHSFAFQPLDEYWVTEKRHLWIFCAKALYNVNRYQEQACVIVSKWTYWMSIYMETTVSCKTVLKGWWLYICETKVSNYTRFSTETFKFFNWHVLKMLNDFQDDFI